MKMANNVLKGFMAIMVFTLAIMIGPQGVLAHCDTLDGPVVIEARAALEKGDVYPLLKWVRAEDEKEIREAFDRAVTVRKLSPEAQKLADMYFFETLVRIHRAGEGAPYTGIKAAGTIEPVIANADQALEKGSVDALAKTIAAHTEQGIRQRFSQAAEARKHAAESVGKGREYVEAYVTYVHYVEGIVQAVHAKTHHGNAPAAPQQH
ncbi:MAG: DUF6448 family protein [Deltaproteobacteria bacterium]